MKTALKIISVILVVAILGVLSLSIRPDYSGVDYSPAVSKNETDKTIRFNSDGKLKILHITDTHLKFNHNFDPTIWMVERACDEENPDMMCLDIMDGTIICDKCRKNAFSTIVKDSFYETGTPRPISIISLSVLATMRYIISSKQERFLAFSLGESEHQMFFDVCEKYLLNQLERGFYSLDFYKSLL